MEGRLKRGETYAWPWKDQTVKIRRSSGAVENATLTGLVIALTNEFHNRIDLLRGLQGAKFAAEVLLADQKHIKNIPFEELRALNPSLAKPDISLLKTKQEKKVRENTAFLGKVAPQVTDAALGAWESVVGRVEDETEDNEKDYEDETKKKPMSKKRAAKKKAVAREEKEGGKQKKRKAEEEGEEKGEKRAKAGAKAGEKEPVSRGARGRLKGKSNGGVGGEDKGETRTTRKVA